jgi:hypothetical protein
VTDRDGFKRGTNYCHRMRGQENPAAVLAAAACQTAACARGEHDETAARAGYTTYVAGRQVEPGTRYCRYCFIVLPATKPPAGSSPQPGPSTRPA